MSMDEENPIPEDHPIQEIWRINRLDTAGLIELAKSGDTDAAKALLVRFSELKRREESNKAIGFVPIGESKKRHEEYKGLLEGYILEAIRLTCRTDDANEGFNLKGKNPNRPVLNYREKLVRCSLGYRVARLIDEMPYKKYLAYDIAAKEFNTSSGNARHCYEKYFKIPNKK